jgi:hypothetical protein
MRLSVAAIFTARRVLLRLLMEQRDLQWGRLLPYRPMLPPEQPSDDRAEELLRIK